MRRPILAASRFGPAGELRSPAAEQWRREEREMAKAKDAKDRVAVITGAGSGIGLATVERLLDAGWKVAALDRDEKALTALAARIAKPQRLFISALDVTNETAAVKAIAMTGEALGRIDGVLNSAGIAA